MPPRSLGLLLVVDRGSPTALPLSASASAAPRCSPSRVGFRRVRGGVRTEIVGGIGAQLSADLRQRGSVRFAPTFRRQDYQRSQHREAQLGLSAPVQRHLLGARLGRIGHRSAGVRARQTALGAGDPQGTREPARRGKPTVVKSTLARTGAPGTISDGDAIDARNLKLSAASGTS